MHLTVEIADFAGSSVVGRKHQKFEFAAARHRHHHRTSLGLRNRRHPLDS